RGDGDGEGDVLQRALLGEPLPDPAHHQRATDEEQGDVGPETGGQRRHFVPGHAGDAGGGEQRCGRIGRASPDAGANGQHLGDDDALPGEVPDPSDRLQSPGDEVVVRVDLGVVDLDVVPGVVDLLEGEVVAPLDGLDQRLEGVVA